MVDVNAHVLGSIINVNKANSAVKVQREPDWTKQNKNTCMLFSWNART